MRWICYIGSTRKIHSSVQYIASSSHYCCEKASIKLVDVYRTLQKKRYSKRYSRIHEIQSIPRKHICGCHHITLLRTHHTGCKK
jgi:hypothetical protein